MELGLSFNQHCIQWFEAYAGPRRQDAFISNLSIENMHGVKSEVRRLIPTNYIASKIGKIFNLLKGPLKYSVCASEIARDNNCVTRTSTTF